MTGEGFRILRAYNNNFSGNLIYDCQIGFGASFDSHSNIFANNTLENNGIGIRIWGADSTDNIIQNNEFLENGLLTTTPQGIVEDNNVNGKPLVYRQNEVTGTVSASDNPGQVVLVNCTSMEIRDVIIEANATAGIVVGESSDITIRNNTVRKNQYGIYLLQSNENTLFNNTVEENIRYGVLLSGSDENTLTNNTANANSMDGIRLEGSDYNEIMNNTADDNTNYGVYLRDFSRFNTVAYNSLFGNGECIRIDGDFMGNPLPNSAFDNHCDNPIPFTFELSSDASGTNFNGSFTLSWEESLYAENYSIYENDEMIAEGLEDPSYAITDLIYGDYEYYVVAINTNGETESNRITINFEEPDPDPDLDPDTPSEFPEITGAVVAVVAAIAAAVAGLVFALKNRKK